VRPQKRPPSPYAQPLSDPAKRKAFLQHYWDLIYADHRISTANNEKFAALSYNESRGLFRLQDGRLVHFTFCKFGDERVFGVEIFDQSGKLIGYGPIRSVPWDTNKKYLVNWDVVWKDDQDRFYIIDEEYTLIVRVVELRYQLASS